MNEDPTVEGEEGAIPEGVVEEDRVSLWREHDDDPLLCDADCVSDEEHALDVVPNSLAEDTPAVSDRLSNAEKSSDVWRFVLCTSEAKV